jgi:metallophosphoesterase superfamily enzyme
MWLRNKYKTTKTVIIGDICDHQAISFHAANPMCPGPIDEYELIKARIKPWHRAFQGAYVTIGNHDRRVLRLAESVNIPAKYIRDYNDTWGTPTWKWVDKTIIDDVYYFHGEGRSGKTPAFNSMMDEGMSVVMGHCHAASGVKWRTAPIHRQFGMDTGCGIDVDAYQMAYGKHFRQRPVLSAGVILDGDPVHHIMPCGPGEKFHKSRFV